MKNLRRDFCEQSVANLESLIKRLKLETKIFGFSEVLARDCFRTLHTCKGTAQTFDFAAAGNLAHALENLLDEAKNQLAEEQQNSSSENYKSLLLEGFGHLTQTFKREDYTVPTEFLTRIRTLFPAESKKSQINLNLPDEFFSCLTASEKTALDSAAANGKAIFCLEIHFDLTSFADEFARVRQILSEKCEIAATLPAAKNDSSAADKIGFRILLATAEDIAEIAEENGAEIVFQTARHYSSSDLSGIFAQIAAHGKTLAARLGKQVEFEIAVEEEEKQVSPELQKAIFDALLHIVRNAVDHAVETPDERFANGKAPTGKIKINFAQSESDFYLTVADDGRGIDAKKIKAGAVEKKLIENGADLSEQAALELIFTPGFSTRDNLTEISGRGVGLDAAKAAVEKYGGKITVKSRVGFGTIFEISLPRRI